MSFLTEKVKGLRLVSAILKTCGFLLVVLQSEQSWPRSIRAIGLFMMLASWYILDFYYRSKINGTADREMRHKMNKDHEAGYSVWYHCSNCGERFLKDFPYGHPAPGTICCPNCHCQTAIKDNSASRWKINWWNPFRPRSWMEKIE